MLLCHKFEIQALFCRKNSNLLKQNSFRGQVTNNMCSFITFKKPIIYSMATISKYSPFRQQSDNNFGESLFYFYC